MSDWITRSIEPDLCDIISGGTPPTENKSYWNGDILWITPADMSKQGKRYISDSERRITKSGIKYSTGKLMPINSVVISCRAPVGYCVMATEPFTTNQGCKTLVCKNIEPGYLYYYLLRSTNELIKVSSGTTFLELSKKELARFKITLPSDVRIQRKIVDVLESVDAVIDESSEIIKKYALMRQGLLFDLLHNGIDENGIIRSPQTHRYKPSAVGSIPEEWVCMRFDRVMPLQRGFDLPYSKRVPGEYPVACSNGIVDYHNAFTTKGPCVWTGRSGTIGHVFFSEKDCWIHNTSLWVTNFNGNDEKFIYYLLSNFNIGKWSSGTGVPTLNRNDLHDQMVALPKDTTEQRQIVKRMEAVEELLEVEEVHLKKAENIRAGLVSDLLSGHVSAEPLA